MRRLGAVLGADWGFDFTPEQIRDMREREPVLDRCDDCGTAYGLCWSVADELALCGDCFQRRHGDSSPCVEESSSATASSTTVEEVPTGKSRDPVGKGLPTGHDNRPRRSEGINASPTPNPVPIEGPVVPVAPLGPLPENATPDVRELAADFAQYWSERVSRGETRPAPYATTFAAGRLGWRTPNGRPDTSRASRAIRKLVRAGVLIEGGPLPPRGKRDGTKTYRPRTREAE